MKTKNLKFNPNNPRTISEDKFNKLVNSIKEFPEMMEKRPLVCVTDDDGKFYPLGGNMRLKAIQELDIKEIPDSWIMLADDWTEEQKKEFVIKDNVSFGEWDFDILKVDWDLKKLNEWAVDIKPLGDDYFDVKQDEEESTYQPTATHDDYSVYELIMKHENKTLLISTLNKIKSENGFDKQEDALMHLIQLYNEKA